MRSHTTSIEIESAADQVLAFVADGGKLPLWAIGLPTAIDADGDRWLVTLASGQRLPLRVDSDGATAVVDYVMLPAPGVEVPPHTRVMPHAGGTLLFAHRADALKLEMQRFTDAGAIFRSHPELRTPPELMDAVLRAIA